MTQAEELEKRAADFTAAFDSLKKAESGTKEFLAAQEAEFKKQLLGSEKDMQEYKEYLSHFANLPAIRKGNQEQYKTYLAQDADAFDYKQLLFIQYMERNAYYHGGEAAHAGVNYSYRKQQLAFYICFLTQFIALLGARLFAAEKAKIEISDTAEV